MFYLSILINMIASTTWLCLIFINSLLIIGLYEATEQGRALSQLHDVLERRLPDFLYKPLLGCVYCMASVWGSIFFLFYFYPLYQVEIYVLLYLPFHILAVSGLNYLLYDMVLFFRK